MGFTSIWHWVIVLIVVLVLFGGKGKLSALMGDFGKGLKNFKDQVKNEDDIFVIQALFRTYSFITSAYLLAPSHFSYQKNRELRKSS